MNMVPQVGANIEINLLFPITQKSKVISEYYDKWLEYEVEKFYEDDYRIIGLDKNDTTKLNLDNMLNKLKDSR